VVTAAENQDIILSPVGTASVIVTNNVQLNAQNDLRFADADSSNYVGFQAPATVATNLVWTLPNADGSANQAIVTNGSGTLSFASAGPALTDNTTDSNTNYLVFTTSTSGSMTAARVATTKLTFQPSTGILTVAGISGYAAAVTLTADNSTNATNYPLFASAATGNLSPRTDTGYTYNPSTGELTAVIVTASSDARLKEEINTIDNALEKVLSLRGVEFVRTENQMKEIGVIAQEVESIIPEVVRTNVDTGLKNVAYGNLVGLLIEAIKDQQKLIEKLSER
jgi:hypothetical protein